MQASDALLLTARSEGGGPGSCSRRWPVDFLWYRRPVVEIQRTVASGVNGWLVDEASSGR